MVMTFTAVATGHNSAPHGRDPNRGIRGRSFVLNDSHQDPIFQLQTDDTDGWCCLKTGATLQGLGNLTITGDLKDSGLVDFNSTGLAIDVDIEGDVDIAGGLDVITADAVNLQPSLSSQFTISINTNSDRTLTLGCNGAAGSDNARNIAITAANVGAGTATITVAAKTEVEVNTITFDVNATGVATINSVGASNFTTDAGNLTISTTTSGSLILTGVALVDLNAGANLDIDVTGSFDMLATTTFSIDGTGASNVTATSGNLSISTLTTGTLILDSVALIDMNAGANIDIDVTGTFDMLSTGVFSIDGTGASNVSATSGNLTISTLTSGTLILDSVALIDMNAGANIDIDVTGSFDVLATGVFSIDGTGASNVTATSGNLTIATLTTGTLILNSVALIDMDAGANLDIDVVGTTDLNTSTSMAFTAGTTLGFTATGGTTSFTCTGRAFTVDGASISLDATGGNCNFTNTSDTAADYTLSLINTGTADANLRNVTITAANAGTGGALLALTGKTVTLTAGTTLGINTTGGKTTWTATAQEIEIACADLDIDTSATVDILAGSTMALASTTTLGVTAGTTLTFTATAGITTFTCAGQEIQMDCATLDMNPTTICTIDAPSISLDATGGDANLSITSDAAANYTLTIATGGTAAANFRNITINAANAGAGGALLSLIGKTMSIESSTIGVTSTGAVTWTHSGGAFAIDSTSQNIGIRTIAGGDITLTSAGLINLAPSTLVQVGGNNVFTSAGVLTAAIQEDTDGCIWVPATKGMSQSGTWTASHNGTLPIVTRTANAASDVYWVNLEIPGKLTASKGFKITSIETIYKVETADLDDVTSTLYRITYGGNGVAATSVEEPSTYDAAHDTAGERGDKDAGTAPGEHTMTTNITTPIYDGAAKVGYMMKVVVDGDAGPAGVFTLKGFLVHYSETIA